MSTHSPKRQKISSSSPSYKAMEVDDSLASSTTPSSSAAGGVAAAAHDFDDDDNKKAQEEKHRALEWVVDRDFSLEPFGDVVLLGKQQRGEE
ncbi:hypothetical protein DV737_g380, partial [Chaetothyriales sp. CBS 132003]